MEQRSPAIPLVEHAGNFVAARFRLPEHLARSGRPSMAWRHGQPTPSLTRRVRGGEHLVSHGDAGQPHAGDEPMSYGSAWDRMVAMTGCRSS